FLLSPFMGAGQKTLTGTVSDSLKQGIANVSVTYGEKGHSGPKGYAITNSDGKYRIVLKPSSADSLWLKANHISFQSQKITIANQPGKHNLQLIRRTKKLQDFEVKDYHRPISRT